MADWEEIKRLAADFQRVQSSDTLQKISERNCIDIVKKLTELNLIELIYTCDGKEFITPSHLATEIELEVHANGGRMQLHDLAGKLNVDYQHVELAADGLARDKSGDYCLIQGQIIHSTYQTTLGKRISDTMLASGQLSIADLAKNLDLPAEFLLTKVKEILPTMMDDFVASPDERTYYSAEMMDQYRSIIAGTLSAIAKPISLSAIMKRLNILERIFTPIVDNLLKEGRIDAQIDNRVLTPSAYTRNQNDWIDKFYTSNNYIDYDSLSRMDIKNPRSFLKKRFPEGTPLKTCFINQENILSQVEPFVEEAIVTKSWVDLSSIIPSAMEEDDMALLMQFLFKKNKNLEKLCFLVNKTYICSLGYLEEQKASFNEMMQAKAHEELRNGKLMDHFVGPKPQEISPCETQEEKTPVETSSVCQNEQDPKSPEAAPDLEATSDHDDTPQQSGKKSKKERREKKSKNDFDDLEDSDEDFSSKRSKSRKSGGGTQGREIKQKAVKKKYITGNRGNQNRGNDQSDEDLVASKTPRSNKGRAARRAISPERQSTVSNKKASRKSGLTEDHAEKEPLIFLKEEEILDKLDSESRGHGECSREFIEAIAEMIGDLNLKYNIIAKKVLDEFIESEAENAGKVDPASAQKAAVE